MAIIRRTHQELVFAVFPPAGHFSNEWRRIYLDSLVLGWLLYFTALIVLTAIYVGIRKNSQRRLLDKDAPKNLQLDAHSRRLSQVPIGESESATFAPEGSFQSGYQAWILGSLLRLLWKIVPVVTQVQLLLLTLENYFGLGWDYSASKFLFVFGISHTSMFLLVKYLANFDTFFMCPCSLQHAEYIAVQYTTKSGMLQTAYLLGVSYLGGTKKSGRYFQFTCVRYLEDTLSSCRFRPVGQLEMSGARAHKTLSNGGLSEQQAAELLMKEGPNQISVKVDSVFESLMMEFSQISYVFQTASIWNYMFWSSWNIASFWLVLVYGCGAWKCLRIIRKNQKQIASMAEAGSDRPQIVLRGGKWVHITAKDLALGDIVQISHGTVPADIALLSGSVIVNESMLTGEPMPLQKLALDSSSQEMYNDKTDGKKHSLYAGTQLLQSVADREAKDVPECEYAIGVVMKIGARTAKGQLIRMVLFPAEVRFKMTEQMPYVYAILSCWAFLNWVAILTASELSAVTSIFVGISSLTQAMNPMMAVSFLLGQSCSAARLQEDSITCLNVGRLPIAGKIATMVFDKTGTITHGGMSLSAVIPVEGSKFSEEVGSARLNEGLAESNLLKALASCHTLTTMKDGTFVGNQVEIVTMQALGWKLSEPGEARRIKSPSGEEIEVLRQLEFDHHRMTSGAVVRTDGRIWVFIKGAYDKISQISMPESLPTDYATVCDRYAAQCFYVLAMSFKELPADADIVSMSRDSLEEELRGCGLILFKNEMKEDSPAVIEELKSGNINCVICTGDNTTTGVSIGRQCGIFSKGARILIGDLAADGQAIDWHEDGNPDKVIQQLPEDAPGQIELALTQSSFRWLSDNQELMSEILPMVKVYGRMKPHDKVSVISLWQNRGPDGTVTGMTGDGGNDCGALRTSHAGIALSESEASMVSPFSTSKGLQDKGYISLEAVLTLVKEGRACLATNMATYQFFMVYNLCLTSSKLLLVIWLDFLYSEWQFVFTDITLAMFMVSCMVRSRPAEKLAPQSPSSSLLGTNALVAISTTVGIYWFTAGCTLVLLLYGPGKSFLELASNTMLEIQGKDWTKKADNHVTACLFLLTATVCSSAGFMFTYGHVHREPIWKNWRMCFFYLNVLIFITLMLWTKPNAISCIFRLNCDNVESHLMNVPFISRAVWGIKLSAGNVGGCFTGPQLVNCKSPTGLCWMALPGEEGNGTLSWDSDTLREEAPFYTLQEKNDYCKQHPYKRLQTDKVNERTDSNSTLGHKWCYSYSSEPDTCQPVPSRDLGPLVQGCVGPNNCFNDDFKLAMSGTLVLCILAMKSAYKFGVLGLGSSLYLPTRRREG